MSVEPRYVDLQVTSNFSFLRGASHPEELARAAIAHGHTAAALTDRNTLAGVVRSHIACKETDMRFIPGCRLDLLAAPTWQWGDDVHDWHLPPKDLRDQGGADSHEAPDGPSLLVYPKDRAAYARLCQLLTLGKRRAPKQQCFLTLDDVAAYAQGLVAVALVPEGTLLHEEIAADFLRTLNQFKDIFGVEISVAACANASGEDARRLWQIADLANQSDVPMVAVNDVHMHLPARRPLLDVLTCIRARCTVDQAGLRIQKNGERHHKPPLEMARLFKNHRGALARTVAIAEACTFSLDELRYEYPSDSVPHGETPQSQLARLAWEGVTWRYADHVSKKVEAQICHELEVIGDLGYAPYFLTVHDIVRYARGRGILCQGRGSAANSAVCYCLGITSVNPDDTELLFERFISAARNEPPDIDVDFEHERREEVIQYIYEKYGRERAGLTATVITYRTRSAVRDVGKALGLSEDIIASLLGTVWGSSSKRIPEEQAREAGLNPDDTRLKLTLDLAEQLKNFPRHLSQHVGGFVLTKGPLSNIVPISNAAMIDRTTIEWDKDDIDALGILKVDVLALGMLTCIRKSFDLIYTHHDRALTLATVPQEDPATYDMLQQADTVGVFQVESRAQMSMLPRLKPATLYDLVIQVAIVRPGPIQGDMVHPYLRRRRQEEPIEYPSEGLKGVLERTLGVPLFQEQAMSIAIVGAGFTPDEADSLRRAMAAWRRNGKIDILREKFTKGMLSNGYTEAFAELCFKQIKGFSDYGFPESHAFSFALLAYVSSWLKCHYPAAFTCALLNSQPMGFYASSQIIQDAQRHGVILLPVDINTSEWDSTLEPTTAAKGVALRLGFRQIKGLKESDTRAIVEARGCGYRDPYDVWQRYPGGGTTLIDTLEKLAKADVFASIVLGGAALSRRQALWAVKALKQAPLPLFDSEEDVPPPAGLQGGADAVFELPPPLPTLSLGEQVVEDYTALRLTLRQHPVAFLRDKLAQRGAIVASDLSGLSANTKVAVAGLSICRQRPGSAKGTVFITLEDESGVVNLIVWPKVFQAFRKQILRSSFLYAEGIVQKDGLVIHVLADKFVDVSGLLYELTDQGPSVSVVSARADRLRHNRRSTPVLPRRFQTLSNADESASGPPDKLPHKEASR
ncbi:MAG: error-prone DNA polymerase [Rhodospirillaceae bacterium]|nr:error-prone DNA polymerase [Rhodospirillaceae bacterium]